MTKGEQTKQLIIEKAAAIFNTKGIEGTSYSDIIQKTKLSKGTHFIHFKDKSDLVVAATTHCLNELERKLNKKLNLTTTAKEQLYIYVDFFSTPNTPPIEGGCPLLNFGLEADDTNEIIRLIIEQGIINAQQIIQEIIEKGIEQKEFKKDWNAQEFALILFALIEGGQLVSRVKKDDSSMIIINKNIKQMIDANSI